MIVIKEWVTKKPKTGGHYRWFGIFLFGIIPIWISRSGIDT